jgi:H+/gluconate symporter-like permease
MKKITLITILLSLILNVFSQDTTRNENSKDYYLQKSKDQKTTAVALFVLGATATVAGVIVMSNANNSNDLNSGFSKIFTGLIIATIGLTLVGLGYSLLIKAKKSKRFAASLAFNNQNVNFLSRNSVRPAPSLSLRINF